MKFPRLSTLRRSAEAAPLPAAMSVLLAIALLFQLLMPVDPDLPAVPVGAGKALTLPRQAIATVEIPSAIGARAMFAPGGGGAKSDSGVPMLIGLARSRGAGVAVLRGSDGVAHMLTIGQSIGRWRLVGLDSASVRLNDGERSLLLRVGEAASTGAPQ
ncbi:hypothetical protein GGR44_000076 [Sphingobium fontiphilum]|uniref:Uncharacterized protein n=1 Tax=Sphingobium fontiphilum TaxID=944425 RepID=A0A7W6DGY8_9SPHN|nr:hypothetical protein [Sphingobium fontiphilum]MBB3980445.1 hypothetical protein [Sphingobium fontiphilum]